MVEPFIGEIRVFPFARIVPNGWLPCGGQSLRIQQYQALYSLLGTRYGGDGKTTFNIPDLRGRVPIHRDFRGQQPIKMGTAAGVETVTITESTMPLHSHALNANSGVGAAASPKSDFFAGAQDKTHLLYGNGAIVALDANTLSSTGGGQPHPNMQPFLVLQFCIATVGLYPPRP